ncbi:MAG: hypothetical protein ABIO76_07950 [Ginsengibacter sp.]
MKTIVLPVIFLISCYALNAQSSIDNITGLWYSSDSSRIYEVEATANKNFEATLYTSKREGDKPGFVILKDVKYFPAKNQYEGVIFSTIDSTATTAKIRLEGDGTILKLKLHRMIFMPVNIEWRRVE